MARAITLDQLIGLNDELAALARIGVPLELGLRDLDRDLPGYLGKVAESVRERLESGKSLPQVIAESPDIFPGTYRAIVQAGIRAGQLSAALESISSAGRRVAEVRRTLRTALVYPVILLVAGYVVFVSFVTRWPHQIIMFRADASLAPLPYLDWLDRLGNTAALWAPWPPVILGLALSVWGVRAFFSKRYPTRGLRRSAALAVFTELLATMVQRQVALDEAIVLAAEATGDPQLIQSAMQWSAGTARGQGRHASAPGSAAGLPAWLTSLINQSTREPQLAMLLRYAARTHRDRLSRQARWYARTLPILLACGIGITVIAVLLATIVMPFYFTLYQMM